MYSCGEPRSIPAMIRPPVMASSMPNSSATRTGLRIGMLASRAALLKRGGRQGKPDGSKIVKTNVERAVARTPPDKASRRGISPPLPRDRLDDDLGAVLAADLSEGHAAMLEPLLGLGRLDHQLL